MIQFLIVVGGFSLKKKIQIGYFLSPLGRIVLASNVHLLLLVV